MTATCPNNPAHDQFLTTAHVMEEWVVDRAGNYLDTETCMETTHGPDPDNLWICKSCGAEAKVTR